MPGSMDLGRSRDDHGFFRDAKAKRSKTIGWTLGVVYMCPILYILYRMVLEVGQGHVPCSFSGFSRYV